MLEKKDMYYNFDMLMPRLIDSFNYLDEEKANAILKSIDRNCICVGTGGSNSVSEFAGIVLNHTNNIITISREPRDILHMNLNGYGNLLGITYGNKNYGINEARAKAEQNKMGVNLITTNSESSSDVCYKGTIPNEYSFISLASTIIPMGILLNYFLKADKNELLERINKMCFGAKEIEYDFNFSGELPIFEIMSGDHTYVASKVLESTITEAGLGIPVVHEKYAYCHGRSTLVHNNPKSNLIYLINGKSNIDAKLLLELEALYEKIIIIQSNEIEPVVGEFDLALQSLFLCKSIAGAQHKDLSKVEYSNVVKKIYKYNGGM